MGAARIPQHALPLQVAAVCYRRRGLSVEFLLVNTNGGNKWTFPKGDPELSLSHCQAAEREAWEEAGVAAASTLVTSASTSIPKESSGNLRECASL